MQTRRPCPSCLVDAELPSIMTSVSVPISCSRGPKSMLAVAKKRRQASILVIEKYHRVLNTRSYRFYVRLATPP